MSRESERRSNKRVLRLSLLISFCILCMIGSGFLLVLNINRAYGNDLSPLIEANPRINVMIIIVMVIFGLVLLAIFIYIFRSTKRLRFIWKKRRRVRRRHRREAAAARKGIPCRYSKKDKLDILEENKLRRAAEREKEKEERLRRAMVEKALKAQGFDMDNGKTGPQASSAEVAGDGSHRFPTLSAYDEDHPAFEVTVPDPGLTLRSIADGFRQYAAGTKGLYYSPSDVAAFLASLSASHTMILQGMSGTGKTSLPIAFGEFLGSPTDVVPVQPTWKERTDILGYYNEFTGRYSESEFLKALYSAGGNDLPRLVVLDEANIARVEYYFAEFLSLLELPDRSKRRVSVAPSGMDGDPERMRGGSILLPPNVWFIMTANNDDSTFAFSDKVYDRASVIDLDRRAEPFEADPRAGIRIGLPDLELLFDGAEARYGLTSRDRRRIDRLDSFLRAAFGVSFGNRVMAQIRRYVPTYAACGLPPLEALDQILSRKVLRKLGAANPVLVRARSGELLALLSELFGEGGAPLCEATVRRISDNG